MSAYHQIFVASEQPVPVLLADLSAITGRELTRTDGAPVDYGAGVGRAAVEVELRHGFEDDYGIPFTRYRVVVTVRDYDRDLPRQEDLARRVFAHLAATGRYALLLVSDLRRLLDSAASPSPGS